MLGLLFVDDKGPAGCATQIHLVTCARLDKAALGLLQGGEGALLSLTPAIGQGGELPLPFGIGEPGIVRGTQSLREPARDIVAEAEIVTGPVAGF